MTNSERFRKIFGVYATEIWALPEEEFLQWLNNEERKTGKWVKAQGRYFTPGGDPMWCCSECGKGRHVYGVEHGSYGADVADGQWVACPNCMAIMEE